MPREFKDYDALAAQKEPVRFRVAGQDYALPAELPASLMFEVYRLQKQGEMSDDQNFEIGMKVISKLFPDGEWDRIVAEVGEGTLNELMDDLLSAYMGKDEENGDAGDPKAGTGGSASPTSSATGEPSTPTSSASGPEGGGTSTATPVTPEPSPGGSSASPSGPYPRAAPSFAS